MKNYYPFDQVSIDPTGVQIPVSAPGKVILNGEHSVVHGKLALAASINLRTQLSISEITLQNTLIVQYHVFKFAYRFDVQQIKELLLKEPLPLLKDQKEYNLESPALLDHEALLNRVEDFLTLSQCTFSSQIEAVAVKAFFYLLTGILGSVNVNLTPILIDCTSELNPGTGLGSSASFAVCIAAALVQYVKSKTTGGDISRERYKPCVWDSNPPTSIEKELDLICRWGYNAEKIIHGTPSGLDNTICTYGSVVEFRRGTPPKLMGTSCALNLLLINSNVPRETKKLVAKVAVYRQKYPEIVDPILEAMDALSKKVLEKILALNEPSGTDNIPEIYSSLGELYTINHNLLNAIGVGHRKLNEIVDILADNGLSGKLTGGGGGGYAICLIPPDFDPARLETTIKSLKLCGFDVIKTDLGGEGVRLENSLK